MTTTELESLYAEVVEQIEQHFSRGTTVGEATAMHEEFCSRVIAVVQQLDIAMFLKDIVVVLSSKLEFHDRKALAGLANGTSADQLEALRAAKAVKVAPSASAAWKHVATNNPEAAVTVIALSYRLFTERKIQSIVRRNRALEQLQLQPQETELV